MEEKWHFYAAFEDRYRGPFEEIKKRVTDYLPYVLAQQNAVAALPALDLGAGRGEWLSLLKEHGVTAIGVDQNPVAAQRARELGLDVRVGDIFDALSEAQDGSFRTITAFHVIEHLPWESQLRLFLECHRVLTLDGVLIVEWPNIENLRVSSYTFWVDPTHIRPLPVQLVAFMAEFAGFASIDVKRFRAPVIESQPRPSLRRRLASFLSRLFDGGFASSQAAAPEIAGMAAMMRAGMDVGVICKK